MSGTVHAAVLRSPYAHARIKSIDTSEVARIPGIKLVLTSKELPEYAAWLPVDTMSDGSKVPRPLLV